MFAKNFDRRKKRHDNVSHDVNSLNTQSNITQDCQCKETRRTVIQLCMQHLKLFLLTV